MKVILTLLVIFSLFSVALADVVCNSNYLATTVFVNDCSSRANGTNYCTKNLTLCTQYTDLSPGHCCGQDVVLNNFSKF